MSVASRTGSNSTATILTSIAHHESEVAKQIRERAFLPRQYFSDCCIEGHVDFIFGDSKDYFRNCEIHVWLVGQFEIETSCLTLRRCVPVDTVDECVSCFGSVACLGNSFALNEWFPKLNPRTPFHGGCISNLARSDDRRSYHLLCRSIPCY